MHLSRAAPACSGRQRAFCGPDLARRRRADAGPVASAATVLIFVIFILIDRENLRNRFLHLIGSRQLNTTTQALDDAARRVSRFLLVQSIVNSIFGLCIAAGLFFIGVPNAFLWGVLAGAMRFLPYVGTIIAASIPLLLATALFPGWTQPVLVLGLFLVIELIVNNAIEPRLYIRTRAFRLSAS